MKTHDDNDWSVYTKDYMYQIIQVLRDSENAFFITPTNVDYYDEGLVFKDKLHANFKELYQSAYKLGVQSILEVGCGGCYHLQNLRFLLPETEIHGTDISLQQIDFGRWFSTLPKDIDDNLFVMNVAKRIPERKYEFVFTQAVVMHQSTDNAMKMMENMKKISSRYIFMMENPNHHGGKDEWRGMVSAVFTDCDISYESRFGTDCVLITKK